MPSEISFLFCYWESQKTAVLQQREGFTPDVTEINEEVGLMEYCLISGSESWTRNLFLKEQICYSDRQLPCPSSNWELKMDQVVFSPTKHNFSDLSKGPGCLHSMKSPYYKNIERKIIQSVKKKKSPHEFLCY